MILHLSSIVLHCQRCAHYLHPGNGHAQGSSPFNVAPATLTKSQENLYDILRNPAYAEYLALLKAARNGAVYGAKIRAPHALV